MALNRFSFLWFVAAGRVKQVVNAMPNCTYWDPVEQGAPSFQPELRYARAKTLVDKDNNPVLDDSGQEQTVYDVLHCWMCRRISSIAIPHLGLSAGVDKLWDVFQMTPRFVRRHEGDVQVVRNLGTKVLNRLGQFIINHPDLNQDNQGRPWVGMPMSFAAVAEMYPTAADRYLRPQRPKAGGAEGETEPVPGSGPQLNPTPSGIDPEVGASIDYRPTNQQMLDDADIPDEMWPIADA